MAKQHLSDKNTETSKDVAVPEVRGSMIGLGHVEGFLRWLAKFYFLTEAMVEDYLH